MSDIKYIYAYTHPLIKEVRLRSNYLDIDLDKLKSLAASEIVKGHKRKDLKHMHIVHGVILKKSVKFDHRYINELFECLERRIGAKRKYSLTKNGTRKATKSLAISPERYNDVYRELVKFASQHNTEEYKYRSGSEYSESEDSYLSKSESEEPDESDMEFIDDENDPNLDYNSDDYIDDDNEIENDDEEQEEDDNEIKEQEKYDEEQEKYDEEQEKYDEEQEDEQDEDDDYEYSKVYVNKKKRQRTLRNNTDVFEKSYKKPKNNDDYNDDDVDIDLVNDEIDNHHRFVVKRNFFGKKRIIIELVDSD